MRNVMAQIEANCGSNLALRRCPTPLSVSFSLACEAHSMAEWENQCGPVQKPRPTEDHANSRKWKETARLRPITSGRGSQSRFTAANDAWRPSPDPREWFHPNPRWIRLKTMSPLHPFSPNRTGPRGADKARDPPPSRNRDGLRRSR
jgi:hypothetical protein